MATAGSTSPIDDQSTPTGSDDPVLSTEDYRSSTNNKNSVPPRPGQHLDDADLLAWKRQYANIGLREKNVLSNSADDLSQLIDHAPYQFEEFGQHYNDMDDDEIHFDNGNNYDYETAIQERLKKANEEFKHDDTPAELKHRQRVSFDAVVKAVDIVQDPQEHHDTGVVEKPPVSPVSEELSNSACSPQSENDGVQYTVPLNDTQPKEGPTLLQQLKAMQFHGVPPVGDRWSSSSTLKTHGSSQQGENVPSTHSHTNNSPDTHDNINGTTDSSALSKKSMVVSINGGFELQSEDDYIARNQKNRQKHNSDSDSDSDDDDDDYGNKYRKSTKENRKLKFLPTPPTDAKPQHDPSRPQTSPRPNTLLNRPKSSDKDNQNMSSANNQQRAKSAGVSISLKPLKLRPSSGIDFKELNRKAAEKKRLALEEERRKQKEAEEKRQQQLTKAQDIFQKWIQKKDTERKRLNDERRLEYEEQEARREKFEKELDELREKKFQEWLERKNREVLIANEFRKLQAEEEKTSNGSSASINSPNRRADHRAFHRWLRRKYEQSREEKRLLRLEARRLRRRQRRSIKRFQLQQDLQLAKSFGYS